MIRDDLTNLQLSKTLTRLDQREREEGDEVEVTHKTHRFELFYLTFFYQIG